MAAPLSRPVPARFSLVGGQRFHELLVVSGPTNQTASTAVGGSFFGGTARSGLDRVQQNDTTTGITFFIVAKDIYGASPGTQTQHTTLDVLHELVSLL